MSNPTALVQKLWNYCNPAAAGWDGKGGAVNKAMI